MTPASAGSPLGARPEGAGSRSDNIAVGRQADAPETIALTQSQQAILKSLSAKQKRNIQNTPHPQPMEGHWFWPGSLQEAYEIARMGLLNKHGFTPAGIALRTTLLQANRNGK